MSLSITGKFEFVLSPEKGTSKAGKDWQKQSFVINTGSEFNPQVCFSLFGEEKMALLNGLKAGQEIEVFFNVSSRAFNSKYYHNLDAWKISVDALENEPAAADIPAATEEDDLPF